MCNCTSGFLHDCAKEPTNLAKAKGLGTVPAASKHECHRRGPQSMGLVFVMCAHVCVVSGPLQRTNSHKQPRSAPSAPLAWVPLCFLGPRLQALPPTGRPTSGRWCVTRPPPPGSCARSSTATPRRWTSSGRASGRWRTSRPTSST